MDFAVKNGCIFFETSAIRGKGTDEAFIKIVEECIQLQNKRNEINRRALTLAVNSKENHNSSDRKNNKSLAESNASLTKSQQSI